jgi:hypothetical protein
MRRRRLERSPSKAVLPVWLSAWRAGLFRADGAALLGRLASSADAPVAALEDSQKQMNLAAGAAQLSMFVWDVPGNESAKPQARRRADKLQGPAISFEKVVETAYPADRDATCVVKQVTGTANFVDCDGRTIDVAQLSPPDPGVFPIVENGQTLVIDVRGATLDSQPSTNP